MSLLFILSLAVLFIQLVYLGLFLLAFIKDRSLSETRRPESVSILVCAQNEYENLRELVPLLLFQDHPDFELIIVDDRSTDGSYDYLLDESKKDPRLRIVRVAERPAHITGKKFALTLGIKAAKHEIILLTDADCRPASVQWATLMCSAFTSGKEIVIGFSPYRKEPGLLNSFIRFETCLTAIQYMSFALLGRPYMGVGRNLAYRKNLFIRTKGFNNHLGVIGGDDDLFVNENATSTNVAVAWGTECLVWSHPKQDLKSFFHQKLRHLSVGKHYRWMDRLLLGLFSLTWILSWLTLFLLPFGGIIAWSIGSIFFLRWILLMALFGRAGKKLGVPLEWPKTPFLDFIYAFYYLGTGPMALFSKKVRWKI